MNKLHYEKPFAEIVEFDTSDVVVVASGGSDPTEKICVFRDPGTGSICFWGNGATVCGDSIGLASV